MDIPVLIIAFTRVRAVKVLLESLRQSRPSRICVSIDGPRRKVQGDIQKCATVKACFDDIDWDCDIVFNHVPSNMGCDPHVQFALDWFFSMHTEGIILEDDCIPSADFFRFAADMLHTYADDQKVMMICGTSVVDDRDSHNADEASYRLSDYCFSWGWATWRRAWLCYKKEISDPYIVSEKKSYFPANEKRFWNRYFESYVSGKYCNWDGKWIHSIWSCGGVCIIPNVNLVLNIGFSADSTHTFFKDKSMPIRYGSLGAIKHPASRSINYAADRRLFDQCFKKNLPAKMIYRARFLFEKMRKSLFARLF